MPQLARIYLTGLLLIGPADLAAQTYSPRSSARMLPGAESVEHADSAMQGPHNGRTPPTHSRTDLPWASPVPRAESILPDSPSAVVPASLVTRTGENAPATSAALPSSEAAFANDAVAIPPPRHPAMPRLAPPGDTSQPGGATTDRRSPIPSLLTIGSSLAVVLGLFLLFAWTLRRATPGATATLPAEVVEVLGRTTLTHRQQLHLLRCGARLVLVNANPDGVQALAEITEPEEVDRLLGLCRQSQPHSASAAFRQVLQQFAGERTTEGFLPPAAQNEARLVPTKRHGPDYRGRERADA